MRKLQPGSVWLLFVGWVFYTLFYAAIAVYFISSWTSTTETSHFRECFTYFLYAVPVLILLVLLWAYLSYKVFGYDLTDQGVQIEAGVVFRKYTTIPYDRIQNLEIYRNLLARLMGLSELRIQTAGAAVARNGKAKAEGSIIGLPEGDAVKLRDDILARTKKK